jgi:hypothetical protein
MDKISERSQRLQALLGEIAEKVAQNTHFIRRKRKITPIAWLLATVFGWMGDKKGTLNTIVEQFEQQEIEITEQAVSKRFDSQAVEFYKQMIAQSCKLLVDHTTEVLPLTQRFNGVYVDDCSTVRLPNDLIDELPGCGGSGSEEKGAAIKTFCRIELLTGHFSEMIFGAGKTSDIKLAKQAGSLPQGALHLADMGFFDSERLRQENAQGIFWITRIPVGVLIEVNHIQQSLTAFFSTCTKNRVDLRAFLGVERLPIRLVGLRVPQKVVQKRQERLRKQAKKKGRKVSLESLFLCEWTIFATNLPEDFYSVDEVYTLYRVRWQIELVFKLWKSEGGVALSHGKTGNRCLCEFLAKLLGQMIAHWLMLLRGGQLGQISPTQLYRQVSRTVPDIVEALGRKDEKALSAVIAKLVNRFDRIRPRKKRKKHPTTRQTLCENVIYGLS